tara:strand:- start:209322 stop:211130 length:1809 start_codon:yes stop_codon:yes gene_type:complete
MVQPSKDKITTFPDAHMNSQIEGEYSSPTDLGAAIVSVLNPRLSETIYDGAFGRLGFLCSAKDYIEQQEEEINPYNFYGSEINRNVFLSSLQRAIEAGLKGDNLKNEDTLKNNSKDEFDVIISHPPLGLRIENTEGDLGIKTSEGTNKFIQHYIRRLKVDGRAAIVVMNSFFTSRSKSMAALRKYLLLNCDLYTVLELPQKTFKHTGVGASVLFLRKGAPTKSIQYYLKDLDEDYHGFIAFSKNGVANEKSFIFDTKELDDKLYLLPTATSLAIDKEVIEKTKNFKNFKCYKIEDLCLEINMTKGKFDHIENAAYLPKIGKSDCLIHINDAILKHQNYFQLVLNKQKISNGYFAYYMRSILGQRILERCTTGSTIPNITKATLRNSLDVYAPDIEEQNLIASTFDELAVVKNIMEKTALELSSDPNSARHILQKLHDTKEAFNQISSEEKIIKIIKGGENLKVEFKETLSKNIHKRGGKDKDLQTSALKNIVGFLNKVGGQLLIGVSDKGEVKGIEEDFYKNDDDYKKMLSNLINDRIGLKEASYIDMEIQTVKSKKVCIVSCSKASNPAYLDDGDFYVRTDPECRKLSAKEANEYIKENFQ